jgi:hypothetical protein
VAASLDLNFAQSDYWVGTAAGSPSPTTLGDVVLGAGTITSAGMAIGDLDDVTVDLTPASLGGGTWFNNSTGTVVIETDMPTNVSGFSRLFEFSDGSNDNRLYALYNGSSFVGATISISGADTDLAGATYAARARLAVAFAAGDIAMSLNGASVVTASATVPTLNMLQLGNRTTTKNRALNGTVYRYRFFPARLSNSELQALASTVSVTATAIATTAPSLGNPVLSGSVNYSLTATGLATTAPSLATPSITQVHAIGTVAAITTGAPALDTPVAGLKYALAAAELNTGPSALGTPTPAQIHALASPGIATGSPALGAVPLVQKHALAAPTALTMGAPVPGHPALLGAQPVAIPRPSFVAASARGYSLPRIGH